MPNDFTVGAGTEQGDLQASAAAVGDDLAQLSRRWEIEGATPEDVLAWMGERFQGDAVLACSFGAEDCVLVDMLSRQASDVGVFYLDTGLMFAETYETRDRLAARYGTAFIQVLPALTVESQAEIHGPTLWSRRPDQCCHIRKVEPLTRALAGRRAWVTGIRRDQAPTRANAPLVEWDHKFGLVKANPLALWTAEQVWDYIRRHEVPYNLLHDRGYPSIGCAPCTRAVALGEDPRAGRWAGFAKTECGIHVESEPAPNELPESNAV